MIWRPATNPEISFEISDEGEVLSFSVSPKFPNVLGLNETTNVQELYQQMVDINSNVDENNHQKADLIREHIETSVQIKNAIEIHNKALERLIDKIN